MHLSTIKINSNRKQLLESQEVKNVANEAESPFQGNPQVKTDLN